MRDFCLPVPRARRVTDVLLVVVTLLIGLSLAGQCAKHLFGHTMLKGFVPTFYVDTESSVPTWYSTAALGFAGALLALIAVAKFKSDDKYRLHWATLRGLFFFMSLDEIAMIHELPIESLRQHFNAGGLLYYTWVVPGAAFAGLFAICFLRFLLSLPHRTKWLFLLAGVVFVSGSIGVEMLSGAQAALYGEETLDYALIVTLEEFLEMLGVVVLIRALLEYIELHIGGVHMQFAHD